MKRIFVIRSAALLLLATTGSTVAARERALTAAASRTYLQLYKDAALADCIATAYHDQPKAAADAKASAGGLDEWSQYDAEGSTGEIPRLVTRYLSRPYASVQGAGVRLDLMKCIDLYHSEDLARLAQRYVPHPTRSYRKDQSKR